MLGVEGDRSRCTLERRPASADLRQIVAHLETVGPLLAEMLEIADLTRLEIHGPEADLAILKPALAGLNPTWFTTVMGVALS